MERTYPHAWTMSSRRRTSEHVRLSPYIEQPDRTTSRQLVVGGQDVELVLGIVRAVSSEALGRDDEPFFEMNELGVDGRGNGCSTSALPTARGCSPSRATSTRCLRLSDGLFIKYLSESSPANLSQLVPRLRPDRPPRRPRRAPTVV
jgi:hypothetical protein